MMYNETCIKQTFYNTEARNSCKMFVVPSKYNIVLVEFVNKPVIYLTHKMCLVPCNPVFVVFTEFTSSWKLIGTLNILKTVYKTNICQ